MALHPRGWQREELQKQLDELQRDYFAQTVCKSSTPAATPMGRSQSSGLTPSLTPAERALAQIVASKATASAVPAHPVDQALQKDGLDMSFQHLRSDVSRMRGTLSELGLAMGESKRNLEVEKASKLAMPQEVLQEFQEQQRVLVEQRRVLEQLRHERQLAESEQYWVHWRNRSAWDGREECLDSSPVNPSLLAEAHAQLRASPGALEDSSFASPPQNDYLLAEFTSVFGFDARDLQGTEFAVYMRDAKRSILSKNVVDGPLNLDGEPAARKIQATIPAASITVEVALEGNRGRAIGIIPLEEIGHKQVSPKRLLVSGSGVWAETAGPLWLEVVLCVVPPIDSGRRLAHTRVVTWMGSAPRSSFPGSELPPSQAHIRERVSDWESSGCPDIHDTQAVHREAASGSAESGPSYLAKSAQQARPVTSRNPEDHEGLGSDAERVAPPFAPSFYASGGWIERSASLLAEEPGPEHTQRTRDSRGAAWQGSHYARAESDPLGMAAEPIAPHFQVQPPFAAFAGFGTQGGNPETFRFAAFSGFDDNSGSSRVGSVRQTADAGVARAPIGDKLRLRPPSSSRPLCELFDKLRAVVQQGRLGQSDVAQDVLEFAFMAAQPGAFHDGATDIGELTAYSAILLDAMEKYPASTILTLWMVEALLSIYNAAGDHRMQLAVPLFLAFVSVALRMAKEPDRAMHSRLLAGLAAVATPDCRIDVRGLVDYTCNELTARRGKMSPLTAEHALAVLCVVRSPHRIADQIFHTLLVLRALKSDVHLVTRALVTLAELYGVLSEELSLARVDEGQTSSPQESRTSDVFAHGVPRDGLDVRLVTTTLDLYPGHRKISGAGLRAYAAMCKLSSDHLRFVIVDDLRGLVQAQRQHEHSHSVALHISEVVFAATTHQPPIIGEMMLKLVARVLHTFTRDPTIVSLGIIALKNAAAKAAHVYTVIDAVPAVELVGLGEIHRADPEIMAPLCSLLATYAAAGGDVWEDLFKAGAVAVPFRAMDSVAENATIAHAAARAVKSLLNGSRAALKQAARMKGSVLLFNTLMAHGRRADVAHAAIAALAVMGQDAHSRRQLVDPSVSATWSVLDALLRVADDTVKEDPDILAQTCCALGTLTYSDSPSAQQHMRDRIDAEFFRRIIERTRVAFSDFAGGEEYCVQLIARAPGSDLKHTRLFDETGLELHRLKPRFGLQAALAAEDTASQNLSTRHMQDALLKTGGKGTFDVYKPLRELGVGTAAPTRLDHDPGKDSEEEGSVEDFRGAPGEGQDAGMLSVRSLLADAALSPGDELASDSESEFIAPQRKPGAPRQRSVPGNGRS